MSHSHTLVQAKCMLYDHSVLAQALCLIPLESCFKKNIFCRGNEDNEVNQGMGKGKGSC